jgi:hypothetical protein
MHARRVLPPGAPSAPTPPCPSGAGPSPRAVAGATGPVLRRALRHRPRLSAGLAAPRASRTRRGHPGGATTETARRGPKKVAIWLGQATQQLRELLGRLRIECGLLVHLSSLRHLGYCWKRCRRALKDQRAPEAFAACQRQLQA